MRIVSKVKLNVFQICVGSLDSTDPWLELVRRGFTTHVLRRVHFPRRRIVCSLSFSLHPVLTIPSPLYAASALAANSFSRSTFAAAFPLFGLQSNISPFSDTFLSSARLTFRAASVQQLRLPMGNYSASVPLSYHGAFPVRLQGPAGIDSLG
jgi:hypothetical protein